MHHQSRPFNLLELLQDQSNNVFRDLIMDIFNNIENLNHRYLIEPFSMEARIKLNKKPRINDNPKFDVTLLLGGLFR